MDGAGASSRTASNLKGLRKVHRHPHSFGCRLPNLAIPLQPSHLQQGVSEQRVHAPHHSIEPGLRLCILRLPQPVKVAQAAAGGVPGRRGAGGQRLCEWSVPSIRLPASQQQLVSQAAGVAGAQHRGAPVVGKAAAAGRLLGKDAVRAQRTQQAPQLVGFYAQPNCQLSGGQRAGGKGVCHTQLDDCGWSMGG